MMREEEDLLDMDPFPWLRENPDIHSQNWSYFGLYRALCSWRIYIIGIKTLHVEVDALYIKGMLNEPDLQPNATINHWIQGILMFDFKLIHVPATRFLGPDALSRRPLAEGEEAVPDDDEWLDNIALFSGISQAPFREEILKGIQS